MKSIVDTSISRRSLLTFAAVGGASLLCPSTALAHSEVEEEEMLFATTGLILEHPNINFRRNGDAGTKNG